MSAQGEDNGGNRSDRMPGLGRPTHFKLPSNREELSEANLSALLNADEDPDSNQDINALRVRRLSNFTLFYADTRELVGLEKLQKKDASANVKIISAHGAARKDNIDLDEAAFEGNAELEDNPDNPGPAPLQFQYCEVILDFVESWWVGNGISNAYVSFVLHISPDNNLP